MRVLQINVVYGEKSTGRTCLEVEKYLAGKGIECYTAYGVGDASTVDNTYKIETKFGYTLHNVLSRALGKEGYYSSHSTKKLIRYIEQIKPDVIHLRNLHGHYLCLPILFRYLKKAQIPLVINLHDCWIYTGKCVYPVRVPCDKWKHECKKCPARKEYPTSWMFDRSEKMFRDKKNWLTGLNVVSVVGVSDWVSNQARESFLNQYPIKRIYNWINLNVFHSYEGKEVFDEFGIPKDKFTVICVAAAWKDGTTKNNELSALVANLREEAQFVVVGAEADSIKGDNVYSVGFLRDTEKLAKLYSASDVYVHLSTADTFGKVIAEAMACGTPAVVYDCTACGELVEEGCGYKVSANDVSALTSAVLKVKDAGKEHYRDTCVERVKRDFDYETNCGELLKLYLEGLNDV